MYIDLIAEKRNKVARCPPVPASWAIIVAVRLPACGRSPGVETPSLVVARLGRSVIRCGFDRVIRMMSKPIAAGYAVKEVNMGLQEGRFGYSYGMLGAAA